MDTQTQGKRQFEEVEETQRKKQATHGRSVAIEVSNTPLPSSDARGNRYPLQSLLSHCDADNGLPKFKQQKIALPIETSFNRVAAAGTTPQCKLCQRVARALHPDFGYRVPKYYDAQGGRFVTLGSWGEILRNENCPSCSRVAELFNIEFQGLESDPRSAEDKFDLFEMAGSSILLRLESDDSGFERAIIINPLARGVSEVVGVLMDKYWVDLERVLQWIQNCTSTHAECHWKNGILGASFCKENMYLISISRECLVKANGGEKYVALSYVWGTSCLQFRTTKADLTFLQSEGSLRSSRAKDHLSATIQRAMHFTSLLDVDFLWVDCLCIVQDDPIHATSQINSMASIYSNSYLTLCAADGADAESGLLGIRECSPPRNVQQHILAFADGLRSSKWVKHVHSDLSVYDERGWTFQEQVLSRRTLTFTGNGLHWRCREVSAQEQTLQITRSPNNPPLDSNIARADTSWPCLNRWDDLVFSYLKRRLTYEEDILRAFSGILESLSTSMPGGFLSGLPQQFFDAALLWIPRENLTRCLDMKSGTVKTALPSWSWAGWKGDRESQIISFGICHQRTNPTGGYMPRKREIYPCVTWFKTDMDTLRSARVPNDYARFRYDGLDGTIKLPLGWSWHREEDDHTYYYKYDNAPPSCTFWYPIPTIRDIQPASDCRWGPILYCKTFRGYLELRGPLRPLKDGYQNLPMYLLNNDEGIWAGVIYVHQAPDCAEEENQRCELVLISGGWAVEGDDQQYISLPEWKYEERPRSGDRYEFYHVLWIEWHDNIAYRKGLGRVVKEVWDDLPKDEIELYLG